MFLRKKGKLHAFEHEWCVWPVLVRSQMTDDNIATFFSLHVSVLLTDTVDEFDFNEVRL